MLADTQDEIVKLRYHHISDPTKDQESDKYDDA